MEGTDPREGLMYVIREELGRGNYLMDNGEVPFTGKARTVAGVLWEKGWRPSDTVICRFRAVKTQQDLLRDQLQSLLREMECEYANASMCVWTNRDEQEGHLSGLLTAMRRIKHKLERVLLILEEIDARLDELTEKENEDDREQ